MNLRATRRWLTARLVSFGRSIAPVLPVSSINLCERLLARMGLHLPILARLVEDNMRAAGLYDEQKVRDYFDQIALHLTNAARVFRLRNLPGAVARLAENQIGLDPSIEHLRKALRDGKGAVLAPAHTVNFVLTLARLNLEVPICIFLRWSKDPQKLRMKREWCEAAGIRVILEPDKDVNPTSRAAACVDVLRDNSILAITPDIAQKNDEGAPVPFFGRQAYLPTGPAAIAMLAEAPLIPLYGRLEGARQFLYATPPIFAEPLGRAEGGRKASLQRVMHQWAVHFEAFIRQCPPAWFLWGDSRWTKVFRNDPRYSAPLNEGER